MTWGFSSFLGDPVRGDPCPLGYPCFLGDPCLLGDPRWLEDPDDAIGGPRGIEG